MNADRITPAMRKGLAVLASSGRLLSAARALRDKALAKGLDDFNLGLAKGLGQWQKW